MRTTEQKFNELYTRGRSVKQIRAVAVARDDKELQKYCQEIIDTLEDIEREL